MYKKMERGFSRCREGEKRLRTISEYQSSIFRGVRKSEHFMINNMAYQFRFTWNCSCLGYKTGSTRREPVVITYAVLTIMNLMAGMTINIYY